jgi:hypothetical protein
MATPCNLSIADEVRNINKNSTSSITPVSVSDQAISCNSTSPSVSKKAINSSTSPSINEQLINSSVTSSGISNNSTLSLDISCSQVATSSPQDVINCSIADDKPDYKKEVQIVGDKSDYLQPVDREADYFQSLGEIPDYLKIVNGVPEYHQVSEDELGYFHVVDDDPNYLQVVDDKHEYLKIVDNEPGYLRSADNKHTCSSVPLGNIYPDLKLQTHGKICASHCENNTASDTACTVQRAEGYRLNNYQLIAEEAAGGISSFCHSCGEENYYLRVISDEHSLVGVRESGNCRDFSNKCNNPQTISDGLDVFKSVGVESIYHQIVDDEAGYHTLEENHSDYQQIETSDSSYAEIIINEQSSQPQAASAESDYSYIDHYELHVANDSLHTFHKFMRNNK